MPNGFGVEPLEVAVATSAVLDKLIVMLVSKGIISKAEASSVCADAIADLQSSPDPQIRKGAEFLRKMYGHT
jgi:hypothetical protein